MKLGIIGLGSIGLRHAKNLLAMGHEVIGYDPSELSMTSIRAMGGLNVGRAEAIGGSVDAVIIASPSPEHWGDAVDAMGNGHKVFVEKPVATRYDDILSNVTMVGYNLVFHSCVKKTKEWLDAGLIGRPLWSNFTLAQWNDRPPYLRDGVIRNWSHEIHLCRYLLGPATVAASSTRLTDGNDDMTDILLTHESGCRSAIHLDYVSKPEIRRFTIVGTIGHLAVDLVSRNAYTNDTEGTRLYHGTDTWDSNYLEEMGAFIQRIDGKETIGCLGEEGLEVLKICLEVRKQAGLE